MHQTPQPSLSDSIFSAYVNHASELDVLVTFFTKERATPAPVFEGLPKAAPHDFRPKAADPGQTEILPEHPAGHSGREILMGARDGDSRRRRRVEATSDEDNDSDMEHNTRARAHDDDDDEEWTVGAERSRGGRRVGRKPPRQRGSPPTSPRKPAIKEGAIQKRKAPAAAELPKSPRGTKGGLWKKYGQKNLKGKEWKGIARGYYRCYHPNCPAKKHVETYSSSGRLIKIEFEGEHNHAIPEHMLEDPDSDDTIVDDKSDDSSASAL